MSGFCASFVFKKQGDALCFDYYGDIQSDASHPIIGIVGDSGMGKTTFLRLLAGLEKAQTNQLAINTETITDSHLGKEVAVEKRGFGYVFQDARLFPHLSVAGNLVYAQKRINRAQKHKDAFSFDNICQLTGVAALLERDIGNLSGGEKQRVAIARALLNHPNVLLLDEPLSSLDSVSRQQLLSVLGKVNRSLRIPMFYVSHQLSEIHLLANDVITIEHNRVKKIQRAAHFFQSLKAVASHHDINYIDFDKVDYLMEHQLLKFGFERSEQSLYCSAFTFNQTIPDQLPTKAHLHASDIVVSTELENSHKNSMLNSVVVTIVEVVSKAAYVELHCACVDISKLSFVCQISKLSFSAMGLTLQQKVTLQFKASALKIGL